MGAIMKKYKVVQWATGVVGSAALKGVIRHPKLELVGVKVYSDEKTGLDAGDIVDMDKTGVIATKDVDVNLIVDIGFPPGLTQEEHVAQGMSTTGFHLVNAVPLVCEADNPGIKTFLDLPMITGCMGTHVSDR
jgi:hypothetical protein